MCGPAAPNGHGRTMAPLGSGDCSKLHSGTGGVSKPGEADANEGLSCFNYSQLFRIGMDSE